MSKRKHAFAICRMDAGFWIEERMTGDRVSCHASVKSAVKALRKIARKRGRHRYRTGNSSRHQELQPT